MPKARIPPPTIELYAVVRADGRVRHRAGGSGLCIYAKASTAKNQARADGDAVVPITVDLSRRPLFIRGEQLDGDT